MLAENTKGDTGKNGRLSENIEDKGLLLSVSYTVGGGMRGGHYRIELSTDHDLSGVTITKNVQELWNSPEEETTNRLALADLAGLQKIIEETGIVSWADLPPNQFRVLDAPSKSIVIWYQNSPVYHISMNQQLPDNCWDVFNSIKGELERLVGLGK